MWNNQVSLSGYLTADIKNVSKTEKDDSVVHFAIGVSRVREIPILSDARHSEIMRIIWQNTAERDHWSL